MAIKGDIFKVTKVTCHIENKSLNKAGFTQCKKYPDFSKRVILQKSGEKNISFKGLLQDDFSQNFKGLFCRVDINNRILWIDR